MSKFTSETGTAAGKIGKRGENELSALAKAIYLKALTGSLEQVQSAMDEIRAEDAYKYMMVVAKMGEKVLPNNIDITSDGEKLSTLTADDIIKRLNRIMAEAESSGGK